MLATLHSLTQSVVQAEHRVAGNVRRHGLPKRVTAYAGRSEVNAAKYPGIGNLGYSRRETGEGSCTRPDFGYDRECRIVAERGGQDIRGRTADGGVAGWVLGMWRSAGG